MFGLGVQELTIILIIIVILFGATRLPALGKGLGGFIKNFKKSMAEAEKIEAENRNSNSSPNS
jgi:sec-independent protein translocase protein TatA